MSTPSSTNSIFNRIRNFRVQLDASRLCDSSDSQTEFKDAISDIQKSDIQINLTDIYGTSNTPRLNLSTPNISNMTTQHRLENMNQEQHEIQLPTTPKLSSPSTISSSHVRLYTHSTQRTKASSNMSMSSPSEFQNVFRKLQSFRVSLDSPQLRSDKSNKVEIESLNASIPSPLQPRVSDYDENKLNLANLSYESQIIANIPSHSNPTDNTLCSTRKSQKMDLKQFLSLPSPPKNTKNTKYTNKRHTKQQILPFHDRYRAQMRQILGKPTTPSVQSASSQPHYYYTSPSVVSENPTIPGHLLMQFPSNNSGETLQEAYAKHKKHRQSVDLDRKRNRKSFHKMKKRLKKKPHLCTCACACHDVQKKASNGTVSYDGDNEEDEKKEMLHKPVIQSTIGMHKKRKKKKKKKEVIRSPPIAVTIKRRRVMKKGISDVDSEQILNEKTETASLSLRGGIVEDLVRLSAISPSPIWYNNRDKLHLKEIRKYSREYTIISSVCCALWSKYELEILKLFKLSWSQRIMAFGEPSVMFYVVDMNSNNANSAKQLFEIAENRFNQLEYVELKYRLNCDKHKFALLCIVDSYYIINETDQYFVDQSHCIPSYLIRNKNAVLS